MNCQVYKSSRQADTYIYLPEGAGIESLPESLRKIFGDPQKVLAVTLEENTQLAQADASQVMRSISERGFYLQLPPKLYKNKHNPWS